MLFRLSAVAVWVCLCAAAQGTLTVDQLVSFIKSSINLKHPDKQVAAYLKTVKLAEKLEDRTVEELQGLGAGPKTVEALHALRDSTATLPAARRAAPPPPPAPIPPPSSEEQARVLEEARNNALNYTNGLPDFICTQVTRRYFDPAGMEFWTPADTLTARLSYNNHREDYKLVLVNNTPTSRGYQDVGGAISSGEFGSLLHEIFAPRSRTDFQWERWGTLRGKRTHVYAFRVSRAYSEYHLVYDKRLDIIVGYKGLVYIDRETNMVVRISFEAVEIPPSFPIQQAGTILDYDYTEISGRQYLLPLRAVVRTRAGKLLTKNDVEFRMYRKFATDTTITFTPEPLPEDQTREQPPK